MEPSGATAIVGSGTAYFISLQPDTARRCAKGQPLSLGVMAAYRLDAKTGGACFSHYVVQFDLLHFDDRMLKSVGRFDLSRWAGSGGVAYNISVQAGAVTGKYGPTHP